jgi:quercetin dioxygenase-like cupin family protein
VQTDKVWGYEIEVVNTVDYCGKILHLNKGYRCSLHCHKIKDETFLVNFGKVKLEVGDEVIIMEKGDSRRIMPGVLHRFSGLEDSEIIEFSTHHRDSDSYREELSGKIPE